MTKFLFEGLDKPVEADWPVTINVPVDGGKIEKREFTARFRLLTPDEITALNGSDDQWAIQRAFWVGMGKDEPVALTPQIFDDVIVRPYFRSGLFAAYQAFTQGAPLGN